MKLRYFASIRERIGKAEQELDIPSSVNSVLDLINWLKTLGTEYEHAFESLETLRCSINQTHAKQTDFITGATEIAFFPPMTGG